MLVALASLFTALQAMQMSQSSAQQKLFEVQLATCTGLNDLEAAVSKNNNDILVWFEDQGPAFDADEQAELRRLLVINDEQAASLQRQHAQLAMLLPLPVVSDAVYEAYSKHVDQNNVGWEVLEAHAVTPASHKAAERLMEQESAHLNTAFTGCSKYIRGVVDGGRINN